MQTNMTDPDGQTGSTAQPTQATQTTSISATAPGQLRVIKRNGTVVPFDASKIAVAMTKAFLAVEGGTAAASSRVHEQVESLSSQIVDTFQRRMPSGGTIHIEDIQDQVELALMRGGEQKIARSYVLYREEHARLREQQAAETASAAVATVQVEMPDGSTQPLDTARISTIVAEACANLEEVSEEVIIEESTKNLYDGVSIDDVNTALVMTARTLVEKEPNYSYVTARLLLDKLRREALTFLDVAKEATHAEMQTLYATALPAYINKGVELELLSPVLREYDLDKLGAALNADRDLQFNYLGLQTLYDRYFVHSGDIRFELPQAFFMRVAMGLAINEDNKEERAIEFYNLLSSFDYMSSTPTLFNSGTLRPQLSSCYLTTVPDDLEGIYNSMRDNALLSKWAGGLGNDWTPVRALGAYIKGTNGKSQGVVRFLKVVNDTAVAVNQGGKRKGAVCAYLETWHLDIEEFLELRKNTGDDRRRTHDMNTANWVPDLFMKRVFEDGDWTLFSPSDAQDLHDLYGPAFETRYNEYEEMTRTGELKLFKRIKAKDLWRKMLGMLFETGHPWVTFKDACNVRSPQQHTGVVHSSNLCTEITLNTNEVGFQDALYKQRTAYGSDAAVEFADRSMEAVSYYAIQASSELADERGRYSTFEGSLWSQGILPIDSLKALEKSRGSDYLDADYSETLDWKSLRERVKTHGMRNSNVMAIAPTATIANITGISQSIEPTYQNLYVKSNLSGEFTVVNPYLVRDLKNHDLWDQVMVNDLKYYEGSVQKIDRIPEDLKALYATSFEIEPRWLVDAASRRQKWIDQAQSLNLYVAGANGKKLDITYRMAWLRGLKTTYYLRALGATSTEKSTIDTGSLNAVSSGAAAPVPQACSIDDPDCEACQ
jgi:ribonucleoside-diphosphate reductase alpha chain